MKYANDPLNRRTKEEWFTNEADATADRTLTWNYDVADQLEAITDRDGSNAAIGADYSYAYDRRGNVLTTTSTLAGLATSVVATNAYDDLDRRTSFEADRGGTADLRNEYQYDTLDRLTQLVQKNQAGGSGVADKHVSSIPSIDVKK